MGHWAGRQGTGRDPKVGRGPRVRRRTKCFKSPVKKNVSGYWRGWEAGTHIERGEMRVRGTYLDPFLAQPLDLRLGGRDGALRLRHTHRASSVWGRRARSTVSHRRVEISAPCRMAQTRCTVHHGGAHRHAALRNARRPCGQHYHRYGVQTQVHHSLRLWFVGGGMAHLPQELCVLGIEPCPVSVGGARVS